MFLLGSVLAVTLITIVFVMLFVRLASRVDVDCTAEEWLETFSAERYAPMQRLLERGDFEYLAAQPGFRPEIGRRLLRERKAVFSEYLSLLVRDFNQLVRISKLTLVYAPEDQPEFARALWREQVRFYGAVSMLRCRLALFPLGVRGSEVGRLVETLATVRRQLTLQPETAA